MLSELASIVQYLERTLLLLVNLPSDVRQIWPRHVYRGCNADFGQKFTKRFHSGVICPKPPNLEGVKQAPHSEQATGQRMHYREILFTPRCSPRAREFPRSGQHFYRASARILTRDIDIANLSVCPSVCPSETFRYQMKTA